MTLYSSINNEDEGRVQPSSSVSVPGGITDQSPLLGEEVEIEDEVIEQHGNATYFSSAVSYPLPLNL